jgi:hypothetical protein
VGIHAPLYLGTYQTRTRYLPPPTQVPCGHGPFLQRPCRDPLTRGTVVRLLLPLPEWKESARKPARPTTEQGREGRSRGEPTRNPDLPCRISHLALGCRIVSLPPRSRIFGTLGSVPNISSFWHPVRARETRHRTAPHLTQVQVQVPCPRRNPPVKAHPPTDLINRNNT